MLYAAADAKGPLATRQLWNLWEIWATKASDCSITALLEAEAVVEIQLRSVRKEPDAEQITAEAEVQTTFLHLNLYVCTCSRPLWSFWALLVA